MYHFHVFYRDISVIYLKSTLISVALNLNTIFVGVQCYTQHSLVKNATLSSGPKYTWNQVVGDLKRNKRIYM